MLVDRRSPAAARCSPSGRAPAPPGPRPAISPRFAAKTACRRSTSDPQLERAALQQAKYMASSAQHEAHDRLRHRFLHAAWPGTRSPARLPKTSRPDASTPRKVIDGLEGFAAAPPQHARPAHEPFRPRLCDATPRTPPSATGRWCWRNSRSSSASARQQRCRRPLVGDQPVDQAARDGRENAGQLLLAHRQRDHQRLLARRDRRRRRPGRW